MPVPPTESAGRFMSQCQRVSRTWVAERVAPRGEAPGPEAQCYEESSELFLWFASSKYGLCGHVCHSPAFGCFMPGVFLPCHKWPHRPYFAQVSWLIANEGVAVGSVSRAGKGRGLPVWEFLRTLSVRPRHVQRYLPD